MPRSDDDDNVPCKTPSPRSSASQAPPNPRHNPDEPPPRINLVQPTAPTPPSHPFKGLSRKFMSKKDPDHKRGRSEGAKLDIGPSHGPYDTPNVRDRVRKWQAAGGGVVMPGDIVDVPPISPATPTPGSRRGVPQSSYGMTSTIGSDMRSTRMRSSTLASNLVSTPLSPPRGPAMINREDWESASEAEKEAVRQRAKSRDRARKMKRRQDRERGRESKTATPDRDSIGTPRRVVTPLIDEDGGVSLLKGEYNDGIRGTLFQEDDGIRVTPMRTKRSASKRKKRKDKLSVEEVATETEHVGDLEPMQPPQKPWVEATGCSTEGSSDQDSDSQYEPSASVKIEIKTFDNDDGIRIYASKRDRSERRPRSDRGLGREGGKTREELRAERRELRKALQEAEEDRVRISELTSRQRAIQASEFRHDIPESSTRELPREVPREIPREIPREAPREIPREVPREVPRVLPKEKSQGTPALAPAVPITTPKSMPKETPKEAPAEKPIEVPWEIAREAAREAARLVAATPKPIPEVSKEAGSALPIDTPKETPIKVPHETSKPVPREIFEEKPEKKMSRQPSKKKKPMSHADNLVRSEKRTGRQNSVRQSARSVRSRKEEFEAQMKKERSAQKEFEALVKKQEEENLRKVSECKDPPIDTEGESHLGPREFKAPRVSVPPKQTWEDYGDGIRVRPLKTRTRSTKRKKSSEGLSRKRSKSLQRLHVETVAESEPEPRRELLRTPVQKEPQLASGSAPATPTGRNRVQRDTESQTPLSVKDRARRFDLGLGPVDLSPETPLKKQDETPAELNPQEKNRNKLQDKLDEKLRERTEETPRPTPKVPPRPTRDINRERKQRRKTMTETPSSADRAAIKRELARSAQSTPFSSTDSLPLRTEKIPYGKPSTPVAREDDMNSRRSSLTPDCPSLQRPPTASKPSTPILGSTTPPLRKMMESPLGPKIATATSSFFKVLKEEFQGKSIRVDEKKKAPELEMSSEDEINQMVEKIVKEVSQKLVADGVIEQFEQESGTVTESASESVSESVSESSESSTESSSESSSDSPSESSSSDSGSESESNTASERNEPDNVVSSSDSETESEKSTADAHAPAQIIEKHIKTILKEGKGKEVVREEPISPTPIDVLELSKPRRNLRNTPAPPRPKSLHSRTGSDGSITPRSSVVGGNRSIDGERDRAVSDASTATVKPLRFNKSRKTSTIDSQKPQEPPVGTDSVEKATDVQEDPEDWYNPDVSVKAPSLKRKYTKHADLISILSVPRSNKSIRSAARSRSGRSKARKKTVETLTIGDLMDELTVDEARYMREMRTVVEDVVPVLFQTVLGRADDDLRRTSSTSSSGTAATVSSRASRAGFSSNPTRPIVDMGITLERLKSLHERIPRDPERFLKWAGDAKRVYEEYLSVWRMGFQDVVVNMPLPPEQGLDSTSITKEEKIRKELEILHGKADGASSTSSKFEGDPSTWEMPPPPIPEGEEEDEKVDVAFLLKRPLVRLKILAKLLKRINYINPSQRAESLSNSFHALVTMARRKISDEKARIEDEAAAKLDVSDVCDMNSLASRTDISLDVSRRVKARDLFQMRLYHSSDKMIEREVELILRDVSTRSRYSEGEVLIVGVDGSHKWLLFPPVPLSMISARSGDAAGEIVVMVRGMNKDSEDWKEIMALASATAAGFEWVQMLGLVPIPPEGPYAEEQPHIPTFLETVIEESIAPSRKGTPVPKPKRKKRNVSYGLRSESVKLKTKNAAGLGISEVEVLVEESVNQQELENQKPSPSPNLFDWIPPDFSAVPLLPAEKIHILGGLFELPKIDVEKYERDKLTLSEEISVYRSPSLHTMADKDNLSPSPSQKTVSSIKRSRKASKTTQLKRRSTIEHGEEEPDSPETSNRKKQLHRSRSVHLDEEARPEQQTSSNSAKVPKLNNYPVLKPTPVAEESEPESDVPPPVPPHRTPPPPKSPPGPTPASPSSSIRSGFGGRRRTSSPLKHEYAPSSTSESGSGTEQEIIIEFVPGMGGEDQNDSSSSSSDDEDSDDASLCSEEEEPDYSAPRLAVARHILRQPSGSISHPRQRPSSISSSSAKIEDSSTEDVEDSSTVVPDGTVLQAPDKVPPPIPQIGIKFRAFVFRWGTCSWEKLLPSICKIIVTPGHIEGYTFDGDLSSNPGSPGSRDSPTEGFRLNESLSLQDRIFELDLNHDTPIRRGTAVDISIRTSKSSSFAGANIMLRSRSPNECEMMFNGINANIHYPEDYQIPTMLSSLVPSEMGGTTNASSTTLGGSIRRGFAWTRGRTYRAGMSTGTPSLVSTPSETSVGSLTSALSRFRARALFKNSSLSSVGSNTSMGDSSRGGTPTELSNLPGIENGFVTMAPMKIRLYLRETSSKWRDLGNARLNVLNPPDTAKSINDKRVVITNKKGTLVLLDVVLGEESFERVARTGIAINILVPEGEADGTGKPGNTGGVGAKNTVYIMQMKGEAEAGYSFSILGKLRY